MITKALRGEKNLVEKGGNICRPITMIIIPLYFLFFWYTLFVFTKALGKRR